MLIMKNEKSKQAFKNLVCGAINEKCTELTKTNGKITYNDGKNIVQFVNMVFLDYIEFVPKEIVVACALYLAVIAPSARERKMLIKKVTTTIGGLGGLGAIVTGIGMALGWGAGTIAAVTAWFTGVSILGPVAWIASGAAITAIAGYFYFSSDDASKAEKFERSLVKGLDKSIDEIWEEHGDAIAKKMHALKKTH